MEKGGRVEVMAEKGEGTRRYRNFARCGEGGGNGATMEKER